MEINTIILFVAQILEEIMTKIDVLEFDGGHFGFLRWPTVVRMI